MACLLLAGATLTVYAHVCNNGFVYDDEPYVVNNPHVTAGLRRQGVLWALTSFDHANWHPLTWLSLQLDATLFGLKPRGYHLHNLLLHAANTLLLFLVLRWATGAVWRSALAAALFALHPLHVESVAWVTERKDVLSTLFWMLTLLAYLGYAQRPGLGRYLLVLLPLALGLMTKPMLVTLPCVLLLLDYWPLQRLVGAAGAPLPRAVPPPKFHVAPLGRLVGEKVPLFILVACSCVVTWWAQNQGGAVASLDHLPFLSRLANALVSYLRYIDKAVWPSSLAAYYPHIAATLPVWQVVSAALALAAGTVLAVRLRRSVPYLLVGWLWYLGTLVPVIGLVQVGGQALADRYTYVPLIGLFLAFSWGLGDLAQRWRCRTIIAGAAGVVLTGCALLTWLQVHYWQDNVSLWSHAREVTERNWLAFFNLAVVLAHDDVDAARHLYVEAIQTNPRLEDARFNLGKLEAAQGRPAVAEQHYAELLDLNPAYVKAHIELGGLLLERREFQAAAAHFAKAVQFDPESALAHYNLGLAQKELGNAAEAQRQYAEAVRLKPDYPEAHNNLGGLLLLQRQHDRAAHHFRKAIAFQPNYPEAHTNLGGMLLAQGQLEEASRHLAEAARLLPHDAASATQLGLVRERQGRLAEAEACHRRAVELEPKVVRYRCNLAAILHELGQQEAARAEYAEVRRLSPNWLREAADHARRLAVAHDPKARDGAAALRLARQVCQATGDSEPAFLDTLAAAQAELGQFDQAAATAARARQLARAAGENTLAEQIGTRVHLYERRLPLREGTPGEAP